MDSARDEEARLRLVKAFPLLMSPEASDVIEVKRKPARLYRGKVQSTYTYGSPVHGGPASPSEAQDAKQPDARSGKMWPPPSQYQYAPPTVRDSEYLYFSKEKPAPGGLDRYVQDVNEKSGHRPYRVTAPDTQLPSVRSLLQQVNMKGGGRYVAPSPRRRVRRRHASPSQGKERRPFVPSNGEKAKSLIDSRVQNSRPLFDGCPFSHAVLRFREPPKQQGRQPFKCGSSTDAKQRICNKAFLNAPDETLREAERRVIRARARKARMQLKKKLRRRVSKRGAAASPRIASQQPAQAPQPS